MFNCEVCGSDTVREEMVSEVFHVNGQYQLVENIPALVCAQCGEKTFSRETAENIRLLLNGSSHPVYAASLAVYSYPVAPDKTGQASSGMGAG